MESLEKPSGKADRIMIRFHVKSDYKSNIVNNFPKRAFIY